MALAMPYRGALFDPLSLFVAGAQGGWYDPSDMSTLFQDRAGTTPVTALGQPVGLILDKSRGLALGPELRANGVIALVGTATAATYNTATGAGTATRVDLNNQSSVAFTGLSTSTTYRITIQNTSAIHVWVRQGSAGGISVGVINPNATQTVLCNTGSQTQLHLAASANGSSITFVVQSISALPGNHLTQTTAASRPLWQQDAAGAFHLAFDGVDDFLTIGTFDMSASDKVTVCAGVRKLSDAARGIVAELSATSATNAGSFALTAPESTAASGNFGFVSGGSLAGSAVAQSATILSPVSRVVTATADIVGDTALVRLNGAQSGATATADQGTGNYGASYPLFVGRRDGTTLPFNGLLHGLVIRGGSITAPELAQLERYMAQKTGIAL